MIVTIGVHRRALRLCMMLLLIVAMLMVPAQQSEAFAPAKQSVASIDIGYAASGTATYEDHVIKHRARHGAHRPRSLRKGTGFVPVKRHFQPI